MKQFIYKNSIIHLHPDGNVVTNPTLTPDYAARFAFALIERWGAVAADADEYAEDSAGRQKMKLQAPEDLVKRAFDIAEKAMAEAEKRGMMIDLQLLLELEPNNEKEK